MKVILVVRHAKAVKRDRIHSDFKRSLTKKGIKEARTVARRLQKEGFETDYIISSPANRAKETAHIFARQFHYPIAQIEWRKEIYDASDNGSLLSLVRNIPTSSSQASIYGHDPSFSDFAQHLIEDFDETMPKGAVVAIGFDTDSWAEINPGEGRLLLFDYPMTKSKMARQLKSVRREIASQLSAMVNHRLQELDPRAAKKIKTYTDKTMRKVAERFLKLAPHLPVGLKSGDKIQRHNESARQNRKV
jgi:phosphohistidine phosphatase